jgi:hypothetical protein
MPSRGGDDRPGDAVTHVTHICTRSAPCVCVRFPSIREVRHCVTQPDLWRAVDQNGHVLDIPVQSWRNARTAKRFFHKLLRTCSMFPA